MSGNESKGLAVGENDGFTSGLAQVERLRSDLGNPEPIRSVFGMLPWPQRFARQHPSFVATPYQEEHRLFSASPQLIPEDRSSRAGWRPDETEKQG